MNILFKIGLGLTLILIVVGIIDMMLWKKMNVKEMFDVGTWVGSAIYFRFRKWLKK